MPDLDRRLDATFASQHGLVTRHQVMHAGGSNAAVHRRLRSGAWERAERGVYGLPSVEWTWHRCLAAAVLSSGQARASHRAAARLAGVGDFARPPVELTVPVGRTPRHGFAQTIARVGAHRFVVHESRDLRRDSTVVLSGIPATSPLRLAIDLGSVVPFDRYRRMVADLRRLHGVDWAQLDQLYRSLGRRGRNGCGALRELLDRHYGQNGAPDEVVEIRCADLLVEAGLPAPEHQYTVRRNDGRWAYLDLAYPQFRIGVETEGRIHDEHEVRQRDHERRNALQLDGWLLFHFTWEDVFLYPERVVATVRTALCAAGWSPTSTPAKPL